AAELPRGGMKDDAMSDHFRLDRFVAAQDAVWPDVLRELRAGAKQSHWMWFVFPQIAGLGHSPTARFFAIGSASAARAYLDHPLLAARLLRSTDRVRDTAARSAREIFGTPDDLKFCASRTLFDAISRGSAVFGSALEALF